MVTAELLLGIATSVAVKLSSWPPLPIWPCQLSPQHITVLPTMIAQVWYAPADIDIASPESPRVAETGLFLFLVVPSPSCPLLFPPQHFTVLSSRIAHVCDEPAEIDSAVLPGPRFTLTPVSLSMVVPSPSCPNSLSPQHLTVPSSSMVQVW